jgi:hypothetical protein
VDKSRGKLRYLATIGTSSNSDEINLLYRQGREWINQHGGQIDLFKSQEQMQQEKHQTETLLSNIEYILPDGTQLILEKVFRSVGYDQINDNILQNPVIARLSQPMSNLATVDYLKSHFDQDVDLTKIYRYLDELHNTQQEKIQQISVEHIPERYWAGLLVLFSTM